MNIKKSFIIYKISKNKTIKEILNGETHQTFSLPPSNSDDSVSVYLNFLFLFIVFLFLVLLVGDGGRVAAVLSLVVFLLLLDAGHAVDVLNLLRAVLDLSGDLVVDF